MPLVMPLVCATGLEWLGPDRGTATTTSNTITVTTASTASFWWRTTSATSINTNVPLSTSGYCDQQLAIQQMNAAAYYGQLQQHEQRVLRQQTGQLQNAVLVREANVRGVVRANAHERALALFKAHLTAEQAQQYERCGFFIVRGGKSKVRYRIRTSGVVGNIDVLDGAAGEWVSHRLCVHADNCGIPAADNWLAQKLMLESQEDELLRIANRH